MSSKAPIYRFSVYINSVLTEVTPIYGDDVSIQYEKEPGTVIRRPSIDGTFTFVRADFDLLNAIGMEDDVEFSAEEFTGTWNAVPGFPAYWRRTDMEIDEDNKIITVRPITRDRYEDILAAMDREFNLAQMEIPLTRVEYKLFPLVQLYVRGSNYVTNYIGGTHWETPVFQPIYDPYALLSLYPGEEGYRFGNDENSVLMFVTGDDTVLTPDVSGEYTHNGSGNNYLRTADGAYEVRLNPALSMPNFQWQIVEKPSNTVVYQKPTNVGLTMPNGFDPHDIPFQGVVDPGSFCDCFQVVVYGRVLCNSDTFDGSPTFDIPEQDLVPANPNYTKVAPFAPSTLAGSIGHQVAPTIYGRFWEDDLHWANQYFVKPPAGSLGKHYPISNSDWKSMSSWFYFDAALLSLFEAEAKEITLEDAWKIADVVAAILAQVDPLVTHEETADYSDFLYGDANPVRDGRKYPIIAPKSNVKLGEYDKPASRAILKLGELLGFLRDSMGVFWYIDSANRFRLEHVRFFRNGLHYTTPQVAADLTTAIEPKTAKLWGYRTNKYKYDKPALPEQIRFKWMDKVSPPFEGYPIELRSAYVTKGNFEERTFAVFTSDLDYIMAQPDSIADDGFVFFEAVFSGGVYSIPFVEFIIEPGEDYYMQNGYASLLYLVDTYLREDLPAGLVTINNAEDTATSVKRSKIQEIDYPKGAGIDPMKLIRTSLGDGAVRSMTITMQSQSYKIVVEHDIP